MKRTNFYPVDKSSFLYGGDGEIPSCRFAATPPANIVALFPVGLDAPCLLTRSTALLPPPAALAAQLAERIPSRGRSCFILRVFTNKKRTPIGVLFLLAEMERFELSNARKNW